MRGRPDFPIDGIMPPDPVTPRETAELVARFTSRYYRHCATCGGSIHWLDAPTGGWWAHDRHPDDGHDATPPRRTHDSQGECICQTIGNPPCHWCSTTCCAEHIDHCLAGFPVPCCERCPDVE